MTLPCSIPFVIEASDIAQSRLESLRMILNQAKAYSRTPVSRFSVGALAVGESGRAYLGTNLEFLHQPIWQTVHAEQFAVALAKLHGESRLSHLVVSEMPCGHCRQFLLELGEPELPVTVARSDDWLELSLGDLLPHPFTLADSNVGLLASYAVSLQLPNPVPGDILAEKALEAANCSYAPYTKAFSGVAIRMKSGSVFHGGLIESAAFNPTLSPCQAALVHLVSAQEDYGNIQEVLLVEAQEATVSLSSSVESFIQSLSPDARIRCLTATP